MAQVPYLDTLLKVELVASTLLILVLLFLGISYKDRILSETGRIKINMNWKKFQLLFFLAIIGMVAFLILLLTELIEVETATPLHTRYEGLEILKFVIATVILLINIVNFNLIYAIIWGGE